MTDILLDCTWYNTVVCAAILQVLPFNVDYCFFLFLHIEEQKLNQTLLETNEMLKVQYLKGFWF